MGHEETAKRERRLARKVVGEAGLSVIGELDANVRKLFNNQTEMALCLGRIENDISNLYKLAGSSRDRELARGGNLWRRLKWALLGDDWSKPW